LRDVKILEAIRSYFNCGVVRFNNREHNVMCYRVRKLEHLVTIIIPFFEKHQLKTVKKVEFLKFKKVIACMQQGKHLTSTGLIEIKNIRAEKFKIESNLILEE
jgi:LAGLIDADG endonuclease